MKIRPPCRFTTFMKIKPIFIVEVIRWTPPETELLDDSKIGPRLFSLTFVAKECDECNERFLLDCSIKDGYGLAARMLFWGCSWIHG